MLSNTAHRVAAIVPTSNREAIFATCLDALLGQTRPPDAVIVVDNGTSERTREVIEGVQGPITYVRLQGPRGSAGGFAAGIRRACDEGFEWLWLMDDDARPYEDALARLLDAADDLPGRVFNSLVVTPDGEKINWGYHLYAGDTYRSGTREMKHVAELTRIGARAVNGLAQFYTGALIHRSVIEAAGVPAEGYFTRGDEVDYVLRIQNAGFKTWTVVDSRVMHPEERKQPCRLFSHRYTVPAVPPWKQYYLLRNELVNARRYNFRGESWLMEFPKMVAAFLAGSFAFPDRRLRRAFYTCWAAIDALAGRVYVNRFVR
jgi:rhamnopyranosyl-N-acetylglucosaminyl-diphospho-decaprenol beta-1,3/1,4-galactofuranosyltransferase